MGQCPGQGRGREGRDQGPALSTAENLGEGEEQGDREGWHETEPNPTQQRIDEEPPEERERTVGLPDEDSNER